MPNMIMLIGIDHVLGIQSLSFSLTRSVEEENLTIELFARKNSKMDVTLAKRVWGSGFLYLPFLHKCHYICIFSVRAPVAASKGNLAMATGNNWQNRVADSYRDQITWTINLRSCHL